MQKIVTAIIALALSVSTAMAGDTTIDISKPTLFDKGPFQTDYEIGSALGDFDLDGGLYISGTKKRVIWYVTPDGYWTEFLKTYPYYPGFIRVLDDQTLAYSVSNDQKLLKINGGNDVKFEERITWVSDDGLNFYVAVGSTTKWKDQKIYRVSNKGQKEFLFSGTGIILHTIHNDKIWYTVDGYKFRNPGTGYRNAEMSYFDLRTKRIESFKAVATTNDKSNYYEFTELLGLGKHGLLYRENRDYYILKDGKIYEANWWKLDDPRFVLPRNPELRYFNGKIVELNYGNSYCHPYQLSVWGEGCYIGITIWTRDIEYNKEPEPKLKIKSKYRRSNW